MNSGKYYSLILCKYFVFFGIRFEFDFSWTIRLLSILTSCIFNLFKANRLLALFLSVNQTNFPFKIMQLLELALDIWLYFFLLFNQDTISDQLNRSIDNLSKEIKIRFINKLRLYRLVYLILVLEIVRLSIYYYLIGISKIYDEEYPFVDQIRIDNLFFFKHLLSKLLVFIALFNQLLNTMLFTLSIFLYFFIYYLQHLQCADLTEQSDFDLNLIEFKSKYRYLQRLSETNNSAIGILPFIWFVFFSIPLFESSFQFLFSIVHL